MRLSGLAAALVFGVFPTMVIAGLTIGQFHTASQIENSRTAARQTRLVSDTANEVEIALEEVERGVRGFILTGDPMSLEPYDNGRDEIAKALRQLDEFAGRDKNLRPMVEPLTTVVTHRLDELSKLVAGRRAGEMAAPEIRAAQNHDDNEMRQIMSLLDQFIMIERDRRESDRETIDRAVIRGNVLALVAGAVAFAALSISAFALLAAYRRSRRSEAVLQATLDSVREGVGAFDENDRLIAWNQHFVELHRVPQGLAQIGTTAADLERLERQRPDPIGHDLLSLKEQATRTGHTVLVERKRDDGTTVELALSPSPDGGFVTSYIDVTDQRRTEALYRQAQRMEALGRMTGGVAHDFNNLLTIVIGNLELLSRRARLDEGHRKLISQALQGAERGTRMTQQLLAFARRQPLEPRSTDLRILIPELIELIQKTLGASIAVNAEIPADLWYARIDPAQFESAILNLALNARDAMAGSGILTLGAANTVIGKQFIEQHADLASGDYVLVSVSDTGSGMSAETLARAFEPFYTTKLDGKGTGLGLSMVYGFTRQSGGHARILSQPGQGTTMELYLPRGTARPEAGIEETAARPRSGTETVLVVEDDDEVRKATVELLEEFGYSVLQAIDGQSGLEVINGSRPIDLLFSDVVMPGLVTSSDLAKAAIAIRPGIAILFTSGYPTEEIAYDGRLTPGIEILTKPYRSQQLATRIRDTLAAKKALAEAG